MASSETTATPSAARLAFYNAVPSVLWSGLALGPLAVFCYLHMARPWLWGLLALSLLAYAVPRAWFRRWQLSRKPATYRHLGVPLINRVTQHGSLVNGLVRRHYPNYRHVRSGRRAVAALIGHSYHMEQFHVAALLFFLFAGGYAAAQGRWGWAALLTLLNVGYNLYPIWLQQYLRLRLNPSKNDASTG
ncbi:glycosyl-4,4'-diaponeurosporenoate acyltransferase CrtO family protein [Hymenobacter perfusus]|uniref:Glycosyl-4,4'-diaponeurosporenoate acyltransferase n=1 Tax=Hymenobacter perfusus TaxID=1236770 RepID=A0A3R9NVB9_9BACT|nr:hypothetical protein [Hymenobacter perfusus]RSK42632.1 hypothetical protein EI293_12585 [Hymenobacter perfusus]